MHTHMRTGTHMHAHTCTRVHRCIHTRTTSYHNIKSHWPLGKKTVTTRGMKERFPSYIKSFTESVRKKPSQKITGEGIEQTVRRRNKKRPVSVRQNGPRWSKVHMDTMWLRSWENALVDGASAGGAWGASPPCRPSRGTLVCPQTPARCLLCTCTFRTAPSGNTLVSGAVDTGPRSRKDIHGHVVKQGDAGASALWGARGARPAPASCGTGPRLSAQTPRSAEPGAGSPFRRVMVQFLRTAAGAAGSSKT